MANTQTLAPGAPIVASRAPRTAPAAPLLVNLKCDAEFAHTWGTQIASSIGPINIGPDGDVEVPVDVASQLLARRPDNKPMFIAASDEELKAIADFQLAGVGQSEALSGTVSSQLFYIQCRDKANEPMNVRDAATDKQVRVDFDADGNAVVTAYILEKMVPAFGAPGGKSESPDAPELLVHGAVGDADDSDAPYFSDDAPRSGPAGTAQIDGQDNIIGVEVEDTDLSRPESQLTPSAKLIEEFNKGTVDNTAKASATEPSTGTTTDTPPSPPVVVSFMDSLKEAIGAPALAALTASGLDTEAELRAASKEQLQGVKGIGTGKLFSKIWGSLHPEPADTGTGPNVTANAETAATNTAT